MANASDYLIGLYKGGKKLSLEHFGNVTSYSLKYILDSALALYGGGDYTFAVKALGDGTTYCSSPWSKQSAPITLGGGFHVTTSGSGYSYDRLGKVLTINQSGTYEISMAAGTAVTDHRIDITAESGTVYLTLDNVSIEASAQSIWFKNGSPVNAEITLKGENRLVSTASTAIQKSGVKGDTCGTLTFRDHAEGGSLYAQVADHGIGGRRNTTNGSNLYNVVFDGATVTAVGGRQAIGSSYTTDNAATFGNVNVTISSFPNKFVRLYVGDNAETATLARRLEMGDSASITYASGAKYAAITATVPPQQTFTITGVLADNNAGQYGGTLAAGGKINRVFFTKNGVMPTTRCTAWAALYQKKDGKFLRATKVVFYPAQVETTVMFGPFLDLPEENIEDYTVEIMIWSDTLEPLAEVYTVPHS